MGIILMPKIDCVKLGLSYPEGGFVNRDVVYCAKNIKTVSYKTPLLFIQFPGTCSERLLCDMCCDLRSLYKYVKCVATFFDKIPPICYNLPGL